MAISSIGSTSYDMVSGLNAQSNMLQMMDMSALTSGTLSSADTTTLSEMFGSDYTNYQNMLSSVSSSSVASTGSTSSTGSGVGLTEDGMFDFKTYFSTYFPNLSDEEITSLTEQYTANYEAMYEQIGGAMDMSNLASLVMGTDSTSDTSSLDTSSILSQASSANSTAGASFDVSSYLSTYFPELSSTQVSSLSDQYLTQYNSLTGEEN